MSSPVLLYNLTTIGDIANYHIVIAPTVVTTASNTKSAKTKKGGYGEKKSNHFLAR
jgi:hypothetical protein